MSGALRKATSVRPSGAFSNDLATALTCDSADGVSRASVHRTSGREGVVQIRKVDDELDLALSQLFTKGAASTSRQLDQPSWPAPPDHATARPAGRPPRRRRGWAWVVVRDACYGDEVFLGNPSSRWALIVRLP